MAGQAFAYELLSGPTGTTYWDKKKAFNGYTLYYPDVSDSTFLIDMQSNVVNVWPAVGNPYLTEDGYLFGMTGSRHDYGDLVFMDWKGKVVKRWKAPKIMCSDGVERQTIFHHDWIVIQDPMKEERTILANARVLRLPSEVTAAGLPAGSGGGFGHHRVRHGRQRHLAMGDLRPPGPGLQPRHAELFSHGPHGLRQDLRIGGFFHLRRQHPCQRHLLQSVPSGSPDEPGQKVVLLCGQA
jgi:hypothetical protein